MTRSKTVDKKIDTDRLRMGAASLAGVVADQADKAAVWAAPHVSRARDEVGRVARDAQVRLEPAYEEARSRVVDDYLPRAQRAAVAAQAAAQTKGTAAERAQRVAIAARNAALAVPEPKKSHRVLKTIGWLAVAGAAAGASYVLWRRSQPVEDPWAEEYWSDSPESASSGSASSTVNDLKTKATDAAEMAQVKASELADQAKAKAAQVKDKASELAGQAKDKASELAGQAKDKAAEVKDQAADKAAEVKDQASHKADEVKDQAADKADDLKDRAADKPVETVDAVAGATTDTFPVTGDDEQAPFPSEPSIDE